MPDYNAASRSAALSLESSPPALPRWRQRLYTLVPAFDSLRTYSPQTFRRDLFAGVTVAAISVPQAMAYASIFGMPVQYGLYTAMVMTAVGALFNTSKQLINGPTNAISIAMLSALAAVPSDQRIAAAIFMATLIGVFQTGITLFRLGDLSRYISQAVIVGFTAGASVLLVLDQLKHALGLKAGGGAHDHFLKRFWLTMAYGGPIHEPTLLVAAATVVAALAVRRMNRRLRWRLPELLLALIAASALSWYFDLGGKGVKLIDKLPREAALPRFELPHGDWLLAQELAPSALAIGMLGLLEAIAMAKSIAAKTGQKLDINQQCLSEGLANFAGSFFQCFPGSGSLARTYINHQAGAATQWSGVISAVMVAVVVLLLAPLAQFIPKAALAGVLLLTAMRMIDVEEIRYHFRATRFDAAMVLATALSAVLVSVEFCILVGTVLSFLMYVPRAASVDMTELVMDEAHRIRERGENDAACPLLRVYAFEGELFFGSGPAFEEHLEDIERQLDDDVRVLVLRVKHLRNPDAVCMKLLHDFIERVHARGVEVCLAGVKEPFLETLVGVGIVDQLGRDRVFCETPTVWTSTAAAIDWAHSRLRDQFCETCPRREKNGAVATEWHFHI